MSKSEVFSENAEVRARKVNINEDGKYAENNRRIVTEI